MITRKRNLCALLMAVVLCINLAATCHAEEELTAMDYYRTAVSEYGENPYTGAEKDSAIKLYTRAIRLDPAYFKEKPLTICEKSAMYLQNEVIFTYKLAKESYNQAKRYDNQNFSGMALLGTVLETAGETLKIHLDIDKEQDAGKAYPYDWVPPSGNLMYLMPKIGTRVSLYFPDSDERQSDQLREKQRRSRRNVPGDGQLRKSLPGHRVRQTDLFPPRYDGLHRGKRNTIADR